MLGLGIIVSAKNVHFSIYDLDIKKIVYQDKILIPKEELMDEPQSYRFLRYYIIDTIDNILIEDKKINYAGIRKIENISMNKNLKRIEMEGIIKESFASSSLLNYSIENKKSMSKKTNFSMNTINNILNNTLTNEDMNLINKKILNWNELRNKEERESALIALSTLSGEIFNGK